MNEVELRRLRAEIDEWTEWGRRFGWAGLVLVVVWVGRFTVQVVTRNLPDVFTPVEWALSSQLAATTVLGNVTAWRIQRLQRQYDALAARTRK